MLKVLRLIFKLGLYCSTTHYQYLGTESEGSPQIFLNNAKKMPSPSGRKLG